MTTKGFLRCSQLFRGVSDELLDLFLDLCQQVRVEAGTPIFEEDQPARFLYIVGHGRVVLGMRLERPDGSVTDLTTVASVGPGEAFGWSALVTPHVLTLSARSVEPSLLLRIEGEALRSTLSLHSDAGYAVMVNVANLLAERLSQTREALVYERGFWLELAQRSKRS